MPIDYDSLDEGDTLNAASLNSRITSLQTGVNDLETVDIEDKALRSEHFDSLVKFDTMFLYGVTNGMMKEALSPGLEITAYDNYLGSPGPSRTVVYIGRSSGLQGYSVISQRVAGAVPPVALPGNVLDCDISFVPSVTVVSPTTPATGYSDTTYCTGLLVRLNVAILAQDFNLTQGVVIGIAWEADGALGTYNFLEQSETGANNQSGTTSQVQYSDLSTSALITSSDTGGLAVARVSGVIASHLNGDPITIREWNMSVIPIFGGAL